MGKQLKISELKRVVNVDKFQKYASMLQDNNLKDEKQIKKILAELDLKTPSRDVLLKTKLGFVLKDLALRTDLSIECREKAASLRSKWKEFHKRLLLAPKYDVKCDKPTTENRENARKTLKNAFIRASSNNNHDATVFIEESEDHMALIADLEFTIFKKCDTLINAKYFNLVRFCCKYINDDSSLRTKFLNYAITSSEFINTCFLNSKSNSSNTNLIENEPKTSSSI
jgi:hypothetical protein